MKITLVALLTLLSIIAVGLWFFAGTAEGPEQRDFVLPDYLTIAPSVSLSDDQKQMISVYTQARESMLTSSTTAAAFADYVLFTSESERAQFIAADAGLGLRLESQQGAIETHSDYSYLFPPRLSHDGKATVIFFKDADLWLMESTQHKNGQSYGYRIENVSFAKHPETGEFKIIPYKVGKYYELSAEDTVTTLAGEPVQESSIIQTPRFLQKTTFVKALDASQTQPVPIEEGVEKVMTYYAENN